MNCTAPEATLGPGFVPAALFRTPVPAAVGRALHALHPHAGRSAQSGQLGSAAEYLSSLAVRSGSSGVLLRHPPDDPLPFEAAP